MFGVAIQWNPIHLANRSFILPYCQEKMAKTEMCKFYGLKLRRAGLVESEKRILKEVWSNGSHRSFGFVTTLLQHSLYRLRLPSSMAVVYVCLPAMFNAMWDA